MQHGQRPVIMAGAWVCRWICGEWLRSWADSEMQDPIDNTPLLCEHGAVSPASLPGARLQLGSVSSVSHTSCG